MKNRILLLAALSLFCIGFTGCGNQPATVSSGSSETIELKTAPELSGIPETIEMDCTTQFNLDDYLSENLKISVSTEEGAVEYELSELNHSLSIDESIYDSTTGEIDTEKPGKYDASLSVGDEEDYTSIVAFTLVIDALKMENTVDELIEMDCGAEFNVLDYLNQNVTITNQAGDTEYTLEELGFTVDCNESVYDAKTGEYDTETYGENKIALVTPGDFVDGKNVVFTVQVDPLVMTSTMEEYIAMDCGTPFNAIDYIKENVTITNQAGDTSFNLEDFDYTVDCDESVYNVNTGDLDTGKFGEFNVTLDLNSESFETSTASFIVNLNPLLVEKGCYIYDSDISSTGYDYLGFCEYRNISSENLEVNEIEFRYYDKDDVMISSCDYPEYSLEFMGSGSSGYALDTYASYNSAVSSRDEIVRVDVVIDYSAASGEDSSLEVGDMEMTFAYDYNVSGFAGTAIVTNPYDKDVEYYSLLAGMYDANGNLIGVMDSMDFNTIVAGEKARCTASWLPDSSEIPNKVASLRASARVTSFAD